MLQGNLNEVAGGDATVATGDATAAAYASSWGITYALLNDPVYGTELQEVMNLLNAGDVSGATKKLQLSKFYQNLGSTAASRAKAKASQPGVYADSLDKYKLAEKKRLAGLGIKLDEATLDAVLTKAFDSAMSEDQLDASISASGKFPTKVGGSIGTSINDLKSYANAYGITYNSAAWDSYNKGLFDGTTTADDIQSKIRQDAASMYPVFADSINQGKSLDSLASAYKSSMANILEVDPDTISWSDNTLKKALQNVDSSGKPALMPLWQFEQQLRNDPRWEYTNNARSTVDSLSLKVLRDWGLA
jgi:hypothetical protein